MSTPPFGSTKCPVCKGTGLSIWGGECDCDDCWVPPKERPDPKEGERRRDEAIDRVDGAAPPEWKYYAYRVLRALCAIKVPYGFTTDDLYFAIQDAGYPPDPPEPRAYGPLMKRAESEGLIAPTDEFRLTERAKAHRRPKRVWRVL